MARKKKEQIKDSEVTELFEAFLKFCPKSHKVDYHCKFDNECNMGKCIIRWMMTYHMKKE